MNMQKAIGFLSFNLEAILDAITWFWRLHPALYYALWALIGVYTSLMPHLALAIPVAFLLVLPLFSLSATPSCRGRLLIGPLAGLVFFTYAETLYQFPLLPDEGIEGVVHFTPTHLRLVPSRLGLSWRIEGLLHAFVSHQEGGPSLITRGRLVMNLPHARKDGALPIESCAYCMDGLITGGQGTYFFKAAKYKPWRKLEPASSLLHVRHLSKQWMEKTIHTAFPDEQVATLLTGLVTGEVTDRQISTTLMRFGLLHIMAVSGLHFSLLIFFLSPLFRCFFSSSWSKLPLVCTLSGYCIFLGPNPSVLRAFSSILVASMGSMLYRSASHCNTLGLSILFFLLYEPSIALLLSFQLSFLATASILLLYAPFNRLLSLLLRSFPLSELLKAHTFDQCAVILLTGLRSSCALTFAVHTTMIPVTLYFFGFFPYLSLFYNLFFPSLIGISLLLLLLGLTLQWVLAPLATYVYALNGIYTRCVLNIALQMPPYWDRLSLRVDPPCELVVAFLSFLFLGAIAVSHRLQTEQQEQEI